MQKTKKLLRIHQVSHIKAKESTFALIQSVQKFLQENIH